MDNHFVPNLTVGPAVAASLVRATSLPVDAHLQVVRPDSLIPAFIEAGVASISVQPEATAHLHWTLTMIRAAGLEAGCALNPTTPREVWPYLDYVTIMSVNPAFGGQAFIPRMAGKVRRLREMTDLPIQVDGGITEKTAPSWWRPGRGSWWPARRSTRATLRPRCERSSPPVDGQSKGLRRNLKNGG